MKYQANITIHNMHSWSLLITPKTFCNKNIFVATLGLYK